ncbi:UPF0743 protein [Escovopsis weberi]|uniref:UPF0743 protein n=1 Tax=Escovopsis weberi TaxID=150374 RepID=A0A0M9VUD3_ESCWE|nr:UPF0743 protein [Escovopsis weberi]
MVSFSCETCGDILTKKKLDPHRSRCRGATFTCIDCMVYFPGFEYRAHTSCMSEEQKYQGALYKPKKPQQRPARATEAMNTLALHPSVEDVPEDKPHETWHECEPRADDGKSPAEPLPEAPTPPPAHEDDSINVFDFLVATGQTPSSSNVNFSQKPKPNPNPMPMPQEKDTQNSTSLVRYQSPPAEKLTGSPVTKAKTDDRTPSKRDPSSPSSKTERRKSKDAEVKKDKKRKRAHADNTSDRAAADAPPSLHTGLTGGLKSLMRLPPSPDLSGDNAPDSPNASPSKKTKHSKHSKSSQSAAVSGSNIFGIISGPTKTKSKSKKDKKDKEKDKDKKDKSEKHSHRHREKKPKLLDYKATPKESHEMVIFSPQVDVFLKNVNKGPESEKGCSMNKALKRFHREREASGSGMTKGQEEKELFKNLRMRRNDRGEIVLFTV